jgi:hypothetical protein
MKSQASSSPPVIVPQMNQSPGISSRTSCTLCGSTRAGLSGKKCLGSACSLSIRQSYDGCAMYIEITTTNMPSITHQLLQAWRKKTSPLFLKDGRNPIIIFARRSSFDCALIDSPLNFRSAGEDFETEFNQSSKRNWKRDILKQIMCRVSYFQTS